MKSLNLDYLHSFVMVVRHGSFSAAAERLQITQPAVSQQVRQLERSLGAVLVERVGRVAKATAAGEELLSHVAGIDAAVGAAVDAVAHRTATGAGRVRIGTGATACIFLLPQLLQRLRARHPRLDITVTTGNTPEIVKAIEENQLDVGLVTLPVAGRSLEIEPVLEDDFMLLAPADMALPRRITAAALMGLPVLMFEPGGNTRRITDAWFASAGVTPQPVMSLGSVEAIKELVNAGLGCAILPGMAVRKLRSPARVAVHPLSPKLHRTLAAVLRRDKRLHPGLAELLREFRRLRTPG